MNISKIKSFVGRILYSLPFGLKRANDEIMGGGVDEGVGISQETTADSLANDLMKGEVTQEVQDLRYRTYTVSEKSRDYKYVGGGIAEKKETKPFDEKKFKFSQECGLICSDILSELKHINDFGEEKYTLNIDYNYPNVIFRLEQFATQIDVFVENEYYETTLHFSSIPNGYEKKSMPFINALKKLDDGIKMAKENGISVETLLNKEEIASSMFVLSFTTYKPTNDFPNMMAFSFFNPQLIRINCDNAEYRLTFKWDIMKMDNLMDKFYSENMAKKYENKERKNVDITFDKL